MVRAYALACHLLPTVAVVSFTTAIAVAAGVGSRALLVLAAVLAGQLSIGWSNDYLDRRADTLAERTDKVVVRGELSADRLRVAAGSALTVCVPLSLLLGRTAGLAHLTAVACGWAYNLGLKGTRLSPLPYLVAFSLLPPVVVAYSLPEPSAPRAGLVLASGLLGVSAHFTNGVKDLAADALAGVRGLPQRLGAHRSALVSAGLLLAAAGVLGADIGGQSTVALSLVAAAAGTATTYALLLLRGPASGRAFTLNLLAVALLVAALVSSGSRLGGSGAGLGR